MSEKSIPNPQFPDDRKEQKIDYHRRIKEAHTQIEKRKWERNVPNPFSKRTNYQPMRLDK